MRIVPLSKELQERYPYALPGHKKKCTCFGCGLERDKLWEKDNPYAAAQAKEQFLQKLKSQQDVVKACESDPLVAKANRNKAITGNPYYKIDGDSIHCGDCGQRLGGLVYHCPFGHQSRYVYGKMLNNPADPRWNAPLYNKSKFNTHYVTSVGIFHEESLAEHELKKRISDAGDVKDLA